MGTDLKKVVRVAANNNFNCTDEEFAQLEAMSDANPDKAFFVNCNIKTPRLAAINDHPFPAVITANPDLHVVEEQIARLYSLDFGMVAFIRVKWLPGYDDIKNLTLDLSQYGYNIVITSQRFNSKVSLRKYTDFKYYEFSCSRYRLSGLALKALELFVDDNARVYMCDRANLGCQGCGLCSQLTVGRDVPILSVNLSTSGVCGYSCPDCYAHHLQKFLIATGKRPMKYDTIQKNRKQRGDTKHIKEARAAAQRKVV